MAAVMARFRRTILLITITLHFSYEILTGVKNLEAFFLEDFGDALDSNIDRVISLFHAELADVANLVHDGHCRWVPDRIAKFVVFYIRSDLFGQLAIFIELGVDEKLLLFWVVGDSQDRAWVRPSIVQAGPFWPVRRNLKRFDHMVNAVEIWVDKPLDLNESSLEVALKYALVHVGL